MLKFGPRPPILSRAPFSELWIGYSVLPPGVPANRLAGPRWRGGAEHQLPTSPRFAFRRGRRVGHNHRPIGEASLPCRGAGGSGGMTPRPAKLMRNQGKELHQQLGIGAAGGNRAEAAGFNFLTPHQAAHACAESGGKLRSRYGRPGLLVLLILLSPSRPRQSSKRPKQHDHKKHRDHYQGERNRHNGLLVHNLASQTAAGAAAPAAWRFWLRCARLSRA